MNKVSKIQKLPLKFKAMQWLQWTMQYIYDLYHYTRVQQVLFGGWMKTKVKRDLTHWDLTDCQSVECTCTTYISWLETTNDDINHTNNAAAAADWRQNINTDNFSILPDCGVRSGGNYFVWGRSLCYAMHVWFIHIHIHLTLQSFFCGVAVATCLKVSFFWELWKLHSKSNIIHIQR